ncbi:MAG: B12-binding domain-containing radical SAM protein [Planctomycetes bacterium]|nr:B12-binding domain-containing radical SAM protein [Planctomycetota bacterium]
MNSGQNSKASILLVPMPPWQPQTPHLGVASLLTYLKSRGYVAELYDLNVKLFNANPEVQRLAWRLGEEEFWLAGRCFEEFADQIDEHVGNIAATSHPIIGFSALYTSVPFANRVIESVRRLAPEKKVVLGGVSCSNEVLRRKIAPGIADVFVMGEGEYVLDHILRDPGILNGTPTPDEIEVFRDDGIETPVFKARKLLDMEEVPFPTFDEFGILENRMSTIPALLSRGCTRKCRFCNDIQLWPKYRNTPPETLTNALEYYHQRYNADNIWFGDLTLTGNLKAMSAFADEMIERGLPVRWGGNAIIRDGMKDELLERMKLAGCWALQFGLESGCAEIVKRMNKGFTLDQARDVFKRTRKAGIKVLINLIVGYPGETEEHLVESVEFLRENSPWIDAVASVNVMTMVPDSWIYDRRDEFQVEGDGSEWRLKDDSNNLLIRLRRKQLLESRLREIFPNFGGGYDFSDEDHFAQIGRFHEEISSELYRTRDQLVKARSLHAQEVERLAETSKLLEQTREELDRLRTTKAVRVAGYLRRFLPKPRE